MYRFDALMYRRKSRILPAPPEAYLRKTTGRSNHQSPSAVRIRTAPLPNKPSASVAIVAAAGGAAASMPYCIGSSWIPFCSGLGFSRGWFGGAGAAS